MTAPAPGSWTYAYLTLSVSLSLVWIALYMLRRDLDVSMLRVSLCTALLGIIEPLFVPHYWNPFTIFNLARRTGFDLESFLFSFAIGGIVFAAYELLFHVEPIATSTAERENGRHRQHTVALLLPFPAVRDTGCYHAVEPDLLIRDRIDYGLFCDFVLPSRPVAEDDR